MGKEGFALLIFIATLAMAAEVYQLPPRSVNVTKVVVSISSIESINAISSGMLKAADISILNPQVEATISDGKVSSVSISQGAYVMYTPFKLYVNNVNLMNISGQLEPFALVETTDGLSLTNPQAFTADLSEVYDVNEDLPFSPLTPTDTDITSTGTADKIALQSLSFNLGPLSVAVDQGELIICPIRITQDDTGTYSQGQVVLLSKIISDLKNGGYTITSITVKFTTATTSLTTQKVAVSAKVNGNTIQFQALGANNLIAESVTVEAQDSAGNSYTVSGESFCNPSLVISSGNLTIDGESFPNGLELKPNLSDVELGDNNVVSFAKFDGVYLPTPDMITLTSTNVTIEAPTPQLFEVVSGTISLNKEPIMLLASLTGALINQPLTNGTNIRNVENMFIEFQGSIIATTGGANIVFYTDQAPPIYAGPAGFYVPPMTFVVKPSTNIIASIPEFTVLNAQVVSNGEGTIYMAPIDVILPELSVSSNTTVSVNVPPSNTTVSVVNKVPSVALLAPLAEALRRSIRKDK